MEREAVRGPRTPKREAARRASPAASGTRGGLGLGSSAMVRSVKERRESETRVNVAPASARLYVSYVPPDVPSLRYRRRAARVTGLTGVAKKEIVTAFERHLFRALIYEPTEHELTQPGRRSDAPRRLRAGQRGAEEERTRNAEIKGSAYQDHNTQAGAPLQHACWRRLGRQPPRRGRSNRQAGRVDAQWAPWSGCRHGALCDARHTGTHHLRRVLW